MSPKKYHFLPTACLPSLTRLPLFQNILGGSLQNLIPGSERLVKAKSDGSLASSATAATNDNSFNRMKSRSLEPLTGLAMWSSECQVIELTKGDRGLGFSILDYQVCELACLLSWRCLPVCVDVLLLVAKKY